MFVFPVLIGRFGQTCSFLLAVMQAPLLQLPLIDVDIIPWLHDCSSTVHGCLRVCVDGPLMTKYRSHCVAAHTATNIATGWLLRWRQPVRIYFPFFHFVAWTSVLKCATDHEAGRTFPTCWIHGSLKIARRSFASESRKRHAWSMYTGDSVRG